MPPVNLKKLVDAKLAQPKITPDDAREVLEVVKKDKKFSASEVKQLERLASLPKSRFEKRDEYIPNPYDPEDGVTVKADPKKWIDGTLELATAKLNVASSIPEISVKLSAPKEFEIEDWGSHLARTLDVTVSGKTASKDGTIAFTYGSRNISVPVKKGEDLEKVINRLESALLKKEGSLEIDGWFDKNKSGKQTIKFEVL
ncbi:MAG: hypothetical protein GQE15_29855 [Archangiaceae bacterium]|nr:hypothetical protein [Archangiaceae bacterium]